MNYGYSNRVILHCDLNNFFASVEAYHNPELNNYPTAVCGSADDRHGIVLAKNEKAKKYGVKTAEAIWQAKQKCPDLVCVPPHYDEYVKFSKAVRQIYYDYTDMVEPFGMDECWLDVTGSTMLFGSGEEIAHTIRKRVKEEIGLTISVGVSFNKVFAKLGSDLKKPDAVTVLSQENFKEKIWHLPASSLIGIGPSTTRALERIGLRTIGEVAGCKPKILEIEFGKCGLDLWRNTNGFDCSPVVDVSEQPMAKSYSKGLTPPKNLTNDGEINALFVSLAESIAHSMREDGVMARVVTISIRDENLITIDRQKRLDNPTRLIERLVGTAMELFRENWSWSKEVRSISIRVSDFVRENEFCQYSLFTDNAKEDKLEKLQKQVDDIRGKYGKNCIVRASAMTTVKQEEDKEIYNSFHPKF